MPTYAISNAVVVINEIRQKQQQTFFLIPTTASFVPSFFFYTFLLLTIVTAGENDGVFVTRVSAFYREWASAGPEPSAVISQLALITK